MLKKYLYNLTSIIPKNSRNNKNHTKNSHTCYVNFPENFKTLNSQVYYLIYIENKGHGFSQIFIMFSSIFLLQIFIIGYLWLI